MNYYIDIRLRPDPEFPSAMLMGALYSKLHRALFDLNTGDIGVSFPDHKTGVRARTPGDRLRLHGQQERLVQLMDLPWLTGMRDHMQVDDTRPVPEKACYLTVKRKQFNTGNVSRVNRYARRHDMTAEEARRLFVKPAERRIDLPFIQINSRSSGQRFALFIEHGKPQPQSAPGYFNHYGLSSVATVPWF